MKKREIIKYARELKASFGTNDPYWLANHYGIRVIFRKPSMGFTAQTIQMDGYTTMIFINDEIREGGKKLLCAHELGHALLHKDTVNYFAVTSKNIRTNVELEANLFAIALLFGEDDFNIPVEQMENSVMDSIIRYNL